MKINILLKSLLFSRNISIQRWMECISNLNAVGSLYISILFSTMKKAWACYLQIIALKERNVWEIGLKETQKDQEKLLGRSLGQISKNFKA